MQTKIHSITSRFMFYNARASVKYLPQRSSYGIILIKFREYFQKMERTKSEMGLRYPLLFHFATNSSITHVRMPHLIASIDGMTYVYEYGEYTYEQLFLIACKKIVHIQQNHAL